jgi:hypothetical protein
MILENMILYPVAEHLLSILEIQTDASSERLMITERHTGNVLWHVRTNGGKTIKRIVPLKYSADPLLMCILFDDNFESNAAIMDGVKSKTINIQTYDVNAPVS